MAAKADSLIRVYLVDEHTLSRIGWRAVLDDALDIDVIGEASYGDEALPVIQKQKPDIVLLNMSLGKANCLEMTETVQLQTDEETKLILFTPTESELELLAAFSIRACGYCAKDIESDVLPEVVKIVHHGGVWFSPTIADSILQMFTAPPIQTPGNTYVMLNDEEISLLKGIAANKNAREACSLYPDLNTCKGHIREILHKISEDERVKQAAKAVREVYSPLHHQALIRDNQQAY